MLKQTTYEIKDNKMTPARVLEIYEDLLHRYKQYTAGEELEFPYDEMLGEILFHLPPIHGRADDRENFKGEFVPFDVNEGTVIATMNSDNWGYPAHILDTAKDAAIRDIVSQMMFPDGNQAADFLACQEF